MKAKEKGIREDEMYWWHWGFGALEIQQALGVGEGQECWCAAVHGVVHSRTQLIKWNELNAIGRMLWTQVLNMSQNGREKDISLTWKIRRLCSNYVCVCEFVYVCLCVCERWGNKWGWMNRQHDGAVWQEVFLSVVSWFLEGAVKGVRNVWLLVLAEAWRKSEVQRRRVWLKFSQA